MDGGCFLSSKGDRTPWKRLGGAWELRSVLMPKHRAPAKADMHFKQTRDFQFALLHHPAIALATLNANYMVRCAVIPNVNFVTNLTNICDN